MIQPWRIVTSVFITAFGNITVPSSMIAFGETYAVGWINVAKLALFSFSLSIHSKRNELFPKAGINTVESSI